MGTRRTVTSVQIGRDYSTRRGNLNLGRLQASGGGAGHAGDPEDPGEGGVLGGKGERRTGNEEATMSLTLSHLRFLVPDAS